MINGNQLFLWPCLTRWWGCFHIQGHSGLKFGRGMGQWDRVELVCLETSRALWNVQCFLPCLKENPNKLENISSLRTSPILRKGGRFSEFHASWFGALLARGPSSSFECFVLLFLRTGSAKYNPGLFVYFSLLPHDSQTRLAKTHSPTRTLKEVILGMNVRQN